MKAALALVLFFLCCVSASHVVVLTDETFDTIIDGSKPALIKFFAPWCGHCKKMAPDYESLAEAYKNKKSEVIIAEVDCDQYKPLCGRFGVTGYPTIKWFNTATDIEDYSRGRTIDSMLPFVNEKTGLKAKLPGAPVSRVFKLTEQNFEKNVLQNDKDVFVKFFAPWCGHCKTIAPIYNDLAAFFENEDVLIAEVDCDEQKDLCAEHGIQGFPTLKWYGEDKEASTKFTGQRDIDGLVEFCNHKLGTVRTTSGLLDETAGLIEEFAPLVARFIEDPTSVSAEEIEEISTAQGTKNAKVYKISFKRILEDPEYVTKETARLNRMIEGNSVTSLKVDEFTMRKNILAQFVKSE